MKLKNNGLSIQLLPKELELFSQIPSYEELALSRHDHWHEKWASIAQAMEKILDLLLERNAIPKIRLKIFTESEYAEKGSKSQLEEFESNLPEGKKFFNHPHFTKYLDYFVNGPSLPQSLVTEFQKLVERDARPDQLRQFIRQKIKQTRLTDSEISSEIFRLAIESGLPVYDAKSLRKEAMEAIRKR